MSSLTPRADKAQKNYLINGGMRLAQRGTSFVAVADSTYTLDRYQYVKTGAMVHTISQDTDVPSFAQSNMVFTNSMHLNLTTPDTAIAASDYCWFTQKIEGYNWANLAQKDFTLSFWVKATLTGTYCVSFGNSVGDRNIPYNYTINATNTWEQKTINVIASPSLGTWDYTNGIGLYVRWILAAGTNFQGTQGVWVNANAWATSSQINGVNTGATDFRITGVTILEGSLSSPAFVSFGKDIESEIRAAQRYYEKSYNLSVAPAAITSVGALATHSDNAATVDLDANIFFKVAKRTTPTVVFYSTVTGATGVWRDITDNLEKTTTAIGTGENSVTAMVSLVATDNQVQGHYTASAEL